MKSDFRGGGGSKMTPKNRTLEGKNRTLGGRGGQKSSKIVGHHLCTFPRSNCQSVFVIRFDHEIKHPILNTYNELQYAKKKSQSYFQS